VVAMNRLKSSWHHTLMLREMLQPTKASETLVREAIRPRFDQLREILRRICPGADALRIDATALSIVGQCLHYKIAGAIIERVIGSGAYQALDLDYLTEHISGFCLAALGLAPPLNEAGMATTAGPAVADETWRNGETS
jgi:TetR/AcrR family transcriptional regulator, regulator of cefoperazone and chloramphenicol sensitivity